MLSQWSYTDKNEFSSFIHEKKILFLDHVLKTLVSFLSLENNIENNVWNQHCIANYLIYRSSHSKMFFKIGVLKNFTNFTGESLEPHFNKVFNKLYKKETPTQLFPCEICNIFKNAFFYRTSPTAASACNIVCISWFIFKLIYFIIW